MKWMASCADDGSQAGPGAVKPCVTRPEQRIQVGFGLVRIAIVTLPFSSMCGSGGTGEEGRRLGQMNNSPAMRREGAKASPDPRVSHAGRPLDHLMTSRVAQWVRVRTLTAQQRRSPFERSSTKTSFAPFNSRIFWSPFRYDQPWRALRMTLVYGASW